MMQIATIGGYSEFGRNMTALNIDDEVILIDCGLHLDKYIQYIGDENDKKISVSEMQKIGAIPDDSVIQDWKKKVKAIAITHAHLDHLGAVPYVLGKYDAPILMTPFTNQVLQAILEDKNNKITNKIKQLNQNAVYSVSDNVKIEFIAMTHSTPQSVMIAVHTRYGAIIYTNDFKFDNNPVLGLKPNYKRLIEIGKKGVAAVIVDSTRADENTKQPSESVAREMLKDVMTVLKYAKKAIIVTTFSSHIARLKSIIELSKILNRKVVIMGRSLHKYISAAEKVKLVNFSKEAEIIKFAKHAKNRIKTIETHREDYILILTGHQGEETAMMSRIARGELPFKFERDDYVIFSCNVIPNEINRRNREELEIMLKRQGVRIIKDIHVSGHAAKEDIRELLHMLKPRNVIPSHGHRDKMDCVAEVSREAGFDSILLLKNGERIVLNNLG